ncbi:hypothetical protein AXA84_0398 [Candidatus Phytoplasma oryzae]|nr:hypothetical protein [Candidatus Phytoplasma oryzae]KXT29080.1 hypothetical protein AXA84_0398 [Candidatus Phytoplasma oryzae]
MNYQNKKNKRIFKFHNYFIIWIVYLLVIFCLFIHFLSILNFKCKYFSIDLNFFTKRSFVEITKKVSPTECLNLKKEDLIYSKIYPDIQPISIYDNNKDEKYILTKIFDRDSITSEFNLQDKKIYYNSIESK